ncbi:hypothetical protein ACSS6W_006544 [Trichoderma asperelloides]
MKPLLFRSIISFLSPTVEVKRSFSFVYYTLQGLQPSTAIRSSMAPPLSSDIPPLLALENLHHLSIGGLLWS